LMGLEVLISFNREVWDEKKDLIEAVIEKGEEEIEIFEFWKKGVVEEDKGEGEDDDGIIGE
jgi:hypothetical protein